MATHSSFLPGKSHGQGSLVAYTAWGYQELDITKSMEDTKETTHTNCLLGEEQKRGPRWQSGKEFACQCKRSKSIPHWSRDDPYFSQFGRQF